MRFLSFTTLFLMVFYGFSQKNDTIYKAGNILYVQQKTFENGELLVVLKDRLGLTIAKGAYKDYEKYEGKFYNANNKHIEKYKNGKIVGKITRNKYTNETYECSYEDYSPIDGDYFSINTLDTYKNKKRIKSIKFDYETGNILSVTFFENVDYEKIVKKVFYKNDEESILHYKDGIPFAGKELTNYGYITFKNGEYNGPFLINDKRVIISGNYKNFDMHGPIKYILASTRDTLVCTFKNGKPVNGTSFESYNLINYKNGKREGCGYKTFNNSRFPYDSLAICYKNDLPLGKATYYLKKKAVAETDYKNGKPYSGSVFNFANLTTYSNGDIVEIDTIIEYKNRQKRYYKNKVLVKEIVRDYKTDSLKYTVEYKNGKPHQGTQLKFDKKSRITTETTYNKGKKEGLQIITDNSYKGYYEQYNYKKNKKEGVAKFKTKKLNNTYTAFFKKDKPVDGVVITNGKKFAIKTTYKDGKISHKSFHATTTFALMANLSYKHEKPFSGIELKYVNGKRNVREYKAGTLIATYINAYNFTSQSEPKARNKVYHSSLKDSLVFTNTLDQRNFVINYDSKKKNSGTITISVKDSSIGSGSFKNNHLTTFNYQYKRKSNAIAKINLKNNNLSFTATQKNFNIKYKIENKVTKQNIYLFLLDIIEGKKMQGAVELYLDNKLISKVIMKNNKPYNGIIFSPNGEFFEVIKVENGKRVKNYSRQTKAEAIEKVNLLKAEVIK